MTLIDREAAAKAIRDAHELKCWPLYFEAVRSGHKTFEIRKNDRDYCEGDVLKLREWSPGTEAYTGRECLRLVTYLTDWEQKFGYVVMGITPLPPVSEPDVAGPTPRVSYDKTTMNKFVQERYNQLCAEGKHGHYETMFRVVHEAIEKAAALAARPDGEAKEDVAGLVGKLNALYEKATPGPWGSGEGCCGAYIDYQAHEPENFGPNPTSDYNGREPLWLGGKVSIDDREFITAIVNAWPEISAAISGGHAAQTTRETNKHAELSEKLRDIAYASRLEWPADQVRAIYEAADIISGGHAAGAPEMNDTESAAIKALKELVRLKRRKDSLDAVEADYIAGKLSPEDSATYEEWAEEYRRCKRPAWLTAFRAADAGTTREALTDAQRYRAWRDGEVIVRRSTPEGFEARHRDDPEWDVGSWCWSMSLDESIDAALKNGADAGTQNKETK